MTQDDDYPEDFDWSSLKPGDHYGYDRRREWVMRWHKQGVKQTDIARRIGRSPTAVWVIIEKELRRRRWAMHQTNKEIKNWHDFMALPGITVKGRHS